MKDLKPGNTLANEALVLHHDSATGHVLAYSVTGGIRGRGEFVTWSIDPEGSTFWGSYFADFDAAYIDYRERRNKA